MKLKELKKGEYFTFIDHKEALLSSKRHRVYIKGDYDRSTRKYEVHLFQDVNITRLVKGDKEVFQNFVF